LRVEETEINLRRIIKNINRINENDAMLSAQIGELIEVGEGRRDGSSQLIREDVPESGSERRMKKGNDRE